MRIVLAFAALAVVIGAVAVVEFPGSPVAMVAGWAIYLFLGLVIQPWGLAALGVVAAIAAIWWTLTRRPE